MVKNPRPAIVCYIFSIMLMVISYVLAGGANNLGLWCLFLVIGILGYGCATFLLIEDKSQWWIYIPYSFACLLAVVGWLFIFGGQHRMLYGPEVWGYYSQGNIVVLGNWMLLVGASLVFIYTTVSFGQSVPFWKWMLRIFIAAEMLFFADQCFTRFEMWQVFSQQFWTINLILVGIFAFALHLVYIKWYKYPAD